MGFERNYQVKILSKQIGKKFFSSLIKNTPVDLIVNIDP
jgi:hypothetical protein